MNTSNVFTSSVRKSAIALAIACAAAAPAMAGTAAHNYSAAGYPVGEAMDFELPASARIARSPSQMDDAPAPAELASSSVASAETSTVTGDSAPQMQQRVVIIQVPQLPQRAQAPITRESVRAELLAARKDGTLTQANEAGDTQQVLTAREWANDEQATAILAEYQAEYTRLVALQEDEAARLFALDADRRETETAQLAADDAMAEVQIDVISIQPEAMGE